MTEAAPGLLAAAAWAVILWWSDRNRATRLWPPHRGSWGAAGWAWGLTILIYVGVIRAGGDGATAPAWLRWGLGGALSLGGTALHSWATFGLGLKGTSGWPVPLKTDGAYALRRHPQYLGQCGMLLGLALLLGGGWALLTALAGTGALVYAALVEDRHLAATARDHAAYRARTRLLL